MGLRILFLAPQPFFEVRGTPLAVRAMVRALADLGHEVDLLTYPQGQCVDLGRVRHLRSLPLPVGHVRPGPSAAKLALDVPFLIEAAVRMALGRYDVVHAVEEAAHACAPLARLLRLPLVADLDSSIPDQLRESGFLRGGPLLALTERLERHALGSAAAVVTVCGSLTARVRERAPEARVFQIEDPPLVDLAGAAPAASAIAALRARLGLDSRPVALYSGNFEAYQGVDLLVDAAALVPEMQIVFMGGETGEIAAQKARCHSGAACVFAGKHPPEDLPLFIAASDVLVSPRRCGVNTPFKVYTYLASGKPVVATRIETHTQLLTDDLAFLVEPTPEGLASGLRKAVSTPAEATRRAQAGRALIEREYSQVRYQQKVRAAYEAIVSGLASRRQRKT